MKTISDQKVLGRVVSTSGSWLFVRQVSKRMFIGAPEFIQNDLADQHCYLRVLKFQGDFTIEFFAPESTLKTLPENNFSNPFKEYDWDLSNE